MFITNRADEILWFLFSGKKRLPKHCLINTDLLLSWKKNAREPRSKCLWHPPFVLKGGKPKGESGTGPLSAHICICVSLFCSLPPGMGTMRMFYLSRLFCSYKCIFVSFFPPIRSEWGCWVDFLGPALLYCMNLELKHTLLLYKLFCILCPAECWITWCKACNHDSVQTKSDQKSAQTADGQTF